jgi:hypothetical protein
MGSHADRAARAFGPTLRWPCPQPQDHRNVAPPGGPGGAGVPPARAGRGHARPCHTRSEEERNGAAALPHPAARGRHGPPPAPPLLAARPFRPGRLAYSCLTWVKARRPAGWID